MNKENIDYTSEEFWATAPKDATHYEPESEAWTSGWIKFCSEGGFYTDGSNEWETEFRQDECDYEELSKTFIPRPTTFTKPAQDSAVSTSDNWFVDGKCVVLPPVGTMVQNDLDIKGYSEVINHRHGQVLVEQEVWGGGVYVLMPKSRLKPYKKEPTIQEKILEAWKAQGIDFAYDNEDTNFSFKMLVNFVVNNFDVREKG